MRLLQLPDGTFVDPAAVRLIEARALRTPWIDADGRQWPAVVTIETHRQVLRLTCGSLAEAVALRDMLGACVNASASKRPRPRPADDFNGHPEEAA